MSKITTLILDAGGVLVHPLHGQWNIPAKYREILGDHAADIPGEAWSTACAKAAPIVREDVPVDGAGAEYALRAQFFRSISADLGWNLSEETLAELSRDFTYNPDRYVWYDDVLPELTALRENYRLGILSDSMPSFRPVVEGHPCHALLDALVISTEIGAGKPDPRMYQEALRKLNARPGECVFVDDREGNLRGAMACGIRGILMCRDGDASWNGPVVHNLTELKAYLEGLN